MVWFTCLSPWWVWSRGSQAESVSKNGGGHKKTSRVVAGSASLPASPHCHHSGELYSPALASSSKTASSKEWGHLGSHPFVSGSSAPTPPGRLCLTHAITRQIIWRSVSDLLLSCPLGWLTCQGYELAHQNILLMCEVLEYRKGPDRPWYKATAGCPRWVPGRAQHRECSWSQRPWTKSMPLPGTLVSKDAWTKGCAVWLTEPHYSLHAEIFPLIFLSVCLLVFGFYF